MTHYHCSGDINVRDEFRQAHVTKLKTWFSKSGEFTFHGCPPSTRERLWNCFSLYEAGDEESIALADAFILGTPIDKNHFTAIVAADLLLTFKGALKTKVRNHLLLIVKSQFVNLMEVRFGSDGLHNFTCMTTFFLLAAGQLLDGYEFNHPLASIPEVYSKKRIQAIGHNALLALSACSHDGIVCSEFNSPTYLPISIICMAKIVEHIDDQEIKQMALEVEGRLWWEALALYHPCLGLSCGPYARAYRIDLLGMSSQMRLLLCYAGISKDKSLLTLLDDTTPGMILHHDGDIPFNWSGPAWKHAQPLHIPCSVLEELKNRGFDYNFESAIKWGSFASISEDGKLFAVQGDVLPAGEGIIKQIQRPEYALGYRSLTTHHNTFPIYLHYRLSDTVETMADVRNVIIGALFQSKPEEWTLDQCGKPMEAGNFDHFGRVMVEEKMEGELLFTGSPLTSLAPIATEEVSISSFIPTHFASVSNISINGTVWKDEMFEERLTEATIDVEDHGFKYSINYQFKTPVIIRLWRWANFIRFAAFWYEGETKHFTVNELKTMTVSGSLKVKNII